MCDVKSYRTVGSLLYFFTTIVFLINIVSIIIFILFCNDECGNEIYWIAFEVIPLMILFGIGCLNACFSYQKSKGNLHGISGISVSLVILALIIEICLTFFKFMIFAMGNAFGLFSIPSFGVNRSQFGIIISSIIVNFIFTLSLMVFSCVTLVSRGNFAATVDNDLKMLQITQI